MGALQYSRARRHCTKVEKANKPVRKQSGSLTPAVRRASWIALTYPPDGGRCGNQNQCSCTGSNGNPSELPNAKHNPFRKRSPPCLEKLNRFENCLKLSFTTRMTASRSLWKKAYPP